MKTLRPQLCCMILVAIAVGSAAASEPMGSQFTFQGQLSQNGTPVHGLVTMRFSLWDEAGIGSPPVGGIQIGTSQIVTDVQVTNGQFAVELNARIPLFPGAPYELQIPGPFGSAPFNGDARWLQVEVCQDPACGATTALAPRNAITPSPYALGPWQVNFGEVAYRGNVTLGAGATNNTALTIRGPNSPTDANSAQDVRFAFSAAGSAGMRAYRGGSWDTHLQFLTNSFAQGFDSPQPRMTIDGEGNVGIGTTAPVATLDVMGNIYIGAGPRYAVPGAEEELKMVRGIVLANGSPTDGCCYSCVRTGVGQYTITFSTPFSAIPTVTCNAYAALNPLHIELITPSATSVRIQVRTAGGTVLDNGFHFLALGPR